MQFALDKGPFVEAVQVLGVLTLEFVAMAVLVRSRHPLHLPFVIIEKIWVDIRHSMTYKFLTIKPFTRRGRLIAPSADSSAKQAYISSAIATQADQSAPT